MSIRSLERDPCWTIVDDSGIQYLEESVPHYDTAQAAMAAIEEILAEHLRDYGDDSDEVPPLLRPEVGEEPCLIVECAHCGYAYDEDDHGIYHMPPLAETTQILDGLWTIDGDVAVCAKCTCEVFGHDFRRPPHACRCQGTITWEPDHTRASDGECALLIRYCVSCSTRDTKVRTP